VGTVLVLVQWARGSFNKKKIVNNDTFHRTQEMLLSRTVHNASTKVELSTVKTVVYSSTEEPMWCKRFGKFR
jgi:hypothetical protein